MTPRRSKIAPFAALAVAVSLSIASYRESSALELSIIESGPGPNPEIGLWVRDLEAYREVNRLVSPSGDVFTPDSILEHRYHRSLIQRFDSLPEAMDFVAGTWNASPAPRSPSRPIPDEEPFDFEITPIPLETINRTPPTLLSPTPSQTIRNGSTFLFAWDYLTSDLAPNRTSITRIPQFDPLSSWGRSIVSTPRPGRSIRLSGGSTSGDQSFAHILTNVPDTDKNRFLETFTASEAHLPLDVELTLGSYYANDSGFPSPRVGFYYSREIDPFIITLSTVPEPATAYSWMTLAIAATLRRARAPRQRR